MCSDEKSNACQVTSIRRKQSEALELGWVERITPLVSDGGELVFRAQEYRDVADIVIPGIREQSRALVFDEGEPALLYRTRAILEEFRGNRLTCSGVSTIPCVT